GRRHVYVAASLACDHLSEIWRADFAGSGPLVVEAPIRSVIGRRGIGWRESPGETFKRKTLRRKRAIAVRAIRRPAMAWPIDNVHFIAFFDQNLNPASPAIRRPHPVQSLPASSMDQH